jgi:hypothetical protein
VAAESGFRLLILALSSLEEEREKTVRRDASDVGPAME